MGSFVARAESCINWYDLTQGAFDSVQVLTLPDKLHPWHKQIQGRRKLVREEGSVLSFNSQYLLCLPVVKATIDEN